jgi:hypothetical protein
MSPPAKFKLVASYKNHLNENKTELKIRIICRLMAAQPPPPPAHFPVPRTTTPKIHPREPPREPPAREPHAVVASPATTPRVALVAVGEP